MLKEKIERYKEDLKGLSNLPQRHYIQDFLFHHNDSYYLSSIQNKNRLDNEDVVIVQMILNQIGKVKWQDSWRFNIEKFYKEYKKLQMNNEF